MIRDGDLVRSMPASAFYLDDTLLANLTNSGYEVGSPEVGVYFVAPPSGCIRLTVGGGFRDNGASALDRVFLAPVLFLHSGDGEQVISPSVTTRGYVGARENSEFQYGSLTSLIEDLTPGELYYVRVMHLSNSGSDPDSADIAARDAVVIPMP